MKDIIWIQILFDIVTLFSPVLSYTPGIGFLAEDSRPEFLPSRRNVTVERGRLAVLPCRVSNLGKRQVAWRRLKDNRFLTVGKVTWIKDSRLLVEYVQPNPKVSEWNLLIKNVDKSSAGRYECQITSMKKNTHIVQLNVIEPKRVHTFFTERQQHDMKSTMGENKQQPRHRPEIRYKKQRDKSSEFQVPDVKYNSGQLQNEKVKDSSGTGKTSISFWCAFVTVTSILDVMSRTKL